MNRKKAVERDCRLWMILAMLVTLLMAVAVPKHIVQAENRQDVICNDINKSVTRGFAATFKGQTCTAVLKNATSSRMRMDITINVQRTNIIKADQKLEQFLCNNASTGMLTTLNGYVIMEPGESCTDAIPV